MEYKPVQKKNSSWTPTTVQKKGKSSAQQGRFSIQPKTNPSSAPSQAIGDYKRASADRLAANAMRGIQAKELELAETPTVQRQSESVGLSSGFDVAPPTTVPPTPKMGTGFPSVSETQIQRQCADCAFEQQEQAGKAGKDLKEIGIQTKLTIGAPGDAYEQEADLVETLHATSLQVMSMSAPPDSSASVQRQLDTNHPHHPHQIWQRAQSITPVVHRQIDPRVQMRQMIQRAAQIDGNQASFDLESRLNASKGGGSPLSEGVRGFMEPRFGADFSGVRVHTGGEAVQMNRELGAQAFTHGSDVYFGAGKSPGNNELTAHELTHVVQQSGDGVKPKKEKPQTPEVSLQERPVVNGIRPKSEVLTTNLQSLRGNANHDSSIYRQEIEPFRSENPPEKIAAAQEIVLESANGDVVQQSIELRTLKGWSTQLLQRQVTNPKCQGTNRRAGIEHEAIQADYIARQDSTGVREYSIPGGSASGNVGYADLVGLGSYAIYEIKPYTPNNITAGLAQVGRYLAAARLNCDTEASWHLGFAYRDTVLPLGSNRELVAKQYGHAGLILYYTRNKRRPEINWESVLEVVLMLGLSLSLIAAILYALLSPEPATKLAAAGLSAAIIVIILDYFGIEDERNQA